MHVTFWFLFLPALVTGLLTDMELRSETLLTERPELRILVGLGYLVASLVVVWGVVCILSIGKRLLQAKSGRARSSFKAVRIQARTYFIPYLLTSILRGVITVLWTLLLIIPGIIYMVRTVFYPVIVVCEGTAYRPALKQSMEIVRGQFWSVLLSVLCLGLLTIVPAQLLSGVFALIAKDAPPQIILAADVATAIIASFALVIYTLSLIQVYAYFKPAGHVSN